MLERDFFRRRNFLQPLYDFGMIAAAVRDRGAGTDLGVAMLRLAHSRIIRRVRDVHDECDVRLERVGDLPRAKQADFLLHVRDGADLGVQFNLRFLQQPQRFGHGEGADAVVERAGHGEITAQNVELVRQGDRVADAHEFLGFLATAHADVYENLVDLRRLHVAVLARQMRGDVADHAFDAAGARVNHDALRLGDGGVNAAHLADVDEAVVVNVVHGHRDFVRVCGEHDARRAALVQHGHAVAVGVGEGFAGEFFGVIEPDALAADFVAGGAGSVDEGLEKFNGCIAHDGKLVGARENRKGNLSFR